MSSFQIGDQCLTAKLKRADYPLPELGAGKYIKVRAMTAKELRDRQTKEKSVRDELTASNPNATEKEIAKLIADDPSMQGNVLIALCAINDDGTPIFTDETTDGKVTKTAAQKAEESLDVGLYSVVGIVDKILELSGIPNSRVTPKN